MFATIIIGVDGGDGGADALALAKRLAGPESRLVATCVAVVEGHPARGANQDDDPRAHAAAVERLRPVLDADPRLEGEILVGSSVAAGLHAAAGRHDADLIVIGSCRRGAVGRILAGDDTRATLRDAPCPVAVAPVDHAVADHPLDVVGVGWDGSPQSEAALDVARAVAGEAHARLRALEVIGLPLWPVPDASMAGQEIAAEVAEAAATVGGLPGVEGTSITGLAVDELARFARELDLLVVGSRQRGPLGRVVIGSTSEGLTRHCPTPLIVVPRTRQPMTAQV
jgi:nucleotide-binding universal stress UspA family protein